MADPEIRVAGPGDAAESARMLARAFQTIRRSTGSFLLRARGIDDCDVIS
ncbi:MAG: hypothetical protein WAL64_05265 [Candidatus Dormiibacterota bacterium]